MDERDDSIRLDGDAQEALKLISPALADALDKAGGAPGRPYARFMMVSMYTPMDHEIRHIATRRTAAGRATLFVNFKSFGRRTALKASVKLTAVRSQTTARRLSETTLKKPVSESIVVPL